MILPISIPLALILLSASLAAAYPTWYLAVFQYKCRPPGIVEAYSQDWKEWRISSVCAPGTCCSSLSETGPLCRAEACEKAGLERERLLKTHNIVEESRRRLEEKKKEKEGDKEKKEKEAEEKWKPIDAQAEADREKALAEKQAQS